MTLRVLLAGHNLDRDLLLEIRSLLHDCVEVETEDARAAAALRERVRQVLARDNWTPETLAAAYARVSRDPRSVTELRRVAREEVDRARRSNESIIFGLGHSSVAEHAVFNLDVLGVSRLAVEVLERGRLSSYTEKSQRYILLEEDWVRPDEIRGTRAEEAYRDTLGAQHAFYREAYDRLLARSLERDPSGRDEKSRLRRLEGEAKEDARYALPLATTVQLGLTINARGLEGLLARCAAHPLAEMRALGEALGASVSGLAPSLVKYTDPTPYRRDARDRLREMAAELAPALPAPPSGPVAEADPAEGTARGIADDPTPECGVRLESTTPEPDATLAAALLYASQSGSYEHCVRVARGLTEAQRRRLLWSHLDQLGPHDPVLREYEHLDLVFDLVVSASCFAQLKRHRMATMTPLPYDPGLGVTVPPSFAEAGLVGRYRALVAAAGACADRIAEFAPEAAPYVLTNGHRRRVLLKMNARELYHFARLREDAHAQWDIRRVARRMVELARERMPLTLALAVGKDGFEAARRDLRSGEDPAALSG